MAVADKSAVVSLREELSHESILQEARSCEDEEFLFFLSRRERQSHVRIENYFEHIKLLYSVSDFLSHFWMSRTTVSCLERLLATCLGLPHGQRNGGRPTFDLQKQVMITIRILGNPDACDQWPIDLTLQNRVYFVFIAEFVERLPTISPINI